MTLVMGPHSGTKQAVMKYANSVGAERLSDVQKFVDELYAQNVFDAYWMCAQSAHETDGWTSSYWVNHLNPAGLAITFDGEKSETWPSGTESARGVLVHHAAYTGY